MKWFRWFLLFGCGLMSLAETAKDDQAGGAFRMALPGYEFEFPRDHGSHPGFRVEWWYVTGHLKVGEESMATLGFQLTFFRIETHPMETRPWLMAHAAITDAGGAAFFHEQRLGREGWDAWARQEDLDLRHGNWTLKRVLSPSGKGDAFQLVSSVHGDVVLELSLQSQKPLVIFGEDGVSKKGKAEGAASHYVTFTRLHASGFLQDGSGRKAVQGEAWMDHEFSSSQLDEGQAGWDWTSIQFEDGRELMAYRLRTSEGGTDPHSRLYWIQKDGRLESVRPEGFDWKVRKTWESPRTGIRYPIEVDLEVRDPQSLNATRLRLRPVLQEQEMVGSSQGMAYWEGACEVLDESGSVLGRAYLELAGYGKGFSEYLKPSANPR